MDHQSQLVEQVFFLAKDFKSGKQEFYEINQQDIFKVAPYIRNANASNIVLDSLYAVVDKIIDKLSNPPGQTSSTPNIKEEPSNDNECSITSVPPPHAAHEPNGMLSMPPGLPRPFADLDRDFLQRGPHPYDSIHMQNQQYQNDQLNNNNQQGFLPKPMFDSEGLNKGYPVNSMNNHPGYFDKNYYNNMPMIPPNTFSASIGLNTYNNSPFGNPVSIGNNYGGSSMIQPPSNTNEKTNAPPPNMSGADKIDESDHEDDDSEDDSNDEDETNRRNFEGSVPLEGSTSYPNKGYAIDPKLIPGLGPTRRTRTKDKYRVVYSDHQRLELEKEFHYSRYITIRRKSELAQGLSLTERQVKIWFQNRRAKERKHMKKRDELMQKEKLDVAATFHAGQLAAASAHASAANMHAASQMAAAFNAGMPPMHLAHPGVMSAAAAASSVAALSHL